MTQAALFIDNAREALQLMLARSGKQRKALALHLRPEMRSESAYAWLSACIEQGGDQRLSFEQYVAAMRFCESYEPLQFMCAELGFEMPRQLAPSDQRAALVDTIKQATATIGGAMRLLEQLGAGS